MITFVYNPIDKMVEAAQNLYPSLKAEIQFNPEINVQGITTFPKDGSTPLIDINSEISFGEAIEALAHELARVATRTMSNDDPKWQEASEKILKEFERIVTIRLKQYTANKQ